MTKLSLAFDLLTRGAAKASSDLDAVGDSSERTGRRVDGAAGSVRRMASTISQSTGDALGPLSELAARLEDLGYAQETTSKRLGAGLTNLGSLGLGAGVLLTGLGAQQREAQAQLSASLEATGSSYGALEGQIDAAVDAGHRFADSRVATLSALNELVLATHDPAVALRDLAVAHDVAAGAHVNLAQASEIVRRAFEGDSEVAKRWGLDLEQTKAAADALTKAQRDSAAANGKVAAAQESYSDKLAVYRQTLRPTLAQQQALFRSHQDLVSAQDNAGAAALRLKDAQKAASDASGAGARNVEQLAGAFRGQASAATDSLTGKLQGLGVTVKDWAAQFGEDYGGAINVASTSTLAIGTLIETGMLPKLGSLIKRLGLTGLAFFGLRDAQVASSAQGAAAVEAGAARAQVAMAAEATAAGRLSTILKSTLGGLSGLALGGVVAAGIGVAIKEAVDTNALTGSLDEQVKALTAALKNAEAGADQAAAIAAAIKRAQQLGVELGANGEIFRVNPTAKNANQQTAGARILDEVKKAQETARQIDAAAKAIAGQQQRDLLSDDPKIAARAAQTIARAQAAAQAAKQQLKAPSAKDSFAEWLKLMGLGDPANAATTAAAAEAARLAKQAAVDTATATRDAIRAEFDNAKSVLQNVMGQAKQLRESIAGSLLQGAQILDVFGTGPNLNANHAFGSGADFERVKKFFETRLERLRRFAAEINVLVHRGLDPAIVAQIAQAGLEQGGRLADALASSSKSELGQINNLNKQVTSIADAAGRRISDVQYREQIAAAKKTNDILSRELKEANQHLRVLSRTKPSAVDQRAEAFRTGS